MVKTRPVRSQASMRPRHISRGNDHDDGRAVRGRPASMRPRHISRGNETRRRSGTRRPGRFNEAAAYQPRKQARVQRFRASYEGFNEAAAYQPRKRIRIRPIRSARRCFNEAAAYQPRKHGPRQSLDLERLASMRPRHISRGNGEHPPHGRAADQASMRPRHISRGNTRRTRRLATATTCFNEAAAYQPRKRARRPLAACRACRFNEAAAYQPRKHASSAPGRAHHSASMRPRHISRGNLPSTRQ